MKMKRKDFDQFNDDFSDFSLSSPARKIRRLSFQNVELPPIMEEDEHPEIAMLSEGRFIPASQDSFPFSESGSDTVGGDLGVIANEERAIVLFKPVNEHFFQASTASPLSVTVDSKLISGFKNEFFRATHFGSLNRVEDEDRSGSASDNATNGCMAVVPWVPSEFFPAQIMTKPLEFMDPEEDADNAMDIEQNNNGGQQQSGDYGATKSECHQKHCMIPQLPPNSPAHIPWFH